MNKILLLMVKQTGFLKANAFIRRMRRAGIYVWYQKFYEVELLTDISEDTLVIVDSYAAYDGLKKRGVETLICIQKENDMDNFPGAKYFVMDVENTEPDYFDKVYRRIKNIPWEILETKRLRIRETIESDVDEFVKIYSNPEVTRYTENLYGNPDEEREYVTMYRETVYATGGYGIWTVIRKADGRIIGRAGITARAGFDNYEVGFVIGADYWHQGYGIEAVSAVMEFARDNNLGVINALVMPENVQSIRLLSKLGFSFDSRLLLNNCEYNMYKC